MAVLKANGSFLNANGKILVKSEGGGGSTVNIGGKEYPYVEIDGRLYITENLDYVWNNLTVGNAGSPSTPAANYYNNDEATYGWNGKRCGLLYNYPAYYALETGNLLPDGWRVMKWNDFYDLYSSVGGEPTAAKKLKAKPLSFDGSWPLGNWAGTDEFGFKSVPAGYSLNGSSFGGFNEYAYFWAESTTTKAFQRFSTADSPWGTYNGSWGYSIRLMKDFKSDSEIPILSDNTNVIYSDQWPGDNGYAWHAFDGNTNTTYWSTQLNNNTNQYVGYDFGNSPKVITNAAIMARVFSNHPQMKDFKIQASNDNTSWVDLYSGTIADSPMESWARVSFTNTNSYRYYRVLVVNVYSSRTICIKQIKMFKDA